MASSMATVWSAGWIGLSVAKNYLFVQEGNIRFFFNVSMVYSLCIAKKTEKSVPPSIREGEFFSLFIPTGNVCLTVRPVEAAYIDGHILPAHQCRCVVTRAYSRHTLHVALMW